MSTFLELDVVRRLLHHEALVHAVPGRVVRDLDDSLILHDPSDPEPFWNRLEAVRFPSDTPAFDRRLAEVAITFANVGRQPHIWLLPPYDAPADLYGRLCVNGFEEVGPRGHVMVATDDRAARSSLSNRVDANVEVTRFGHLHGPEAEAAATSIVGVLVPAFSVDETRRTGVIGETLASLADPRFSHYLVRVDGRPAAVARRATFDGVSYLSSIATIEGARGRGLGRRVTAVATVDAFEAGSEYVHLGVYADNEPAKGLYERLGFSFVGEAGPDMLLTG